MFPAKDYYQSWAFRRSPAPVLVIPIGCITAKKHYTVQTHGGSCAGCQPWGSLREHRACSASTRSADWRWKWSTQSRRHQHEFHVRDRADVRHQPAKVYQLRVHGASFRLQQSAYIDRCPSRSRPIWNPWSCCISSRRSRTQWGE